MIIKLIHGRSLVLRNVDRFKTRVYEQISIYVYTYIGGVRRYFLSFVIYPALRIIAHFELQLPASG